ncbi:hypothetical protein E2562_020986 [Oryza meyeriana var. granulata]|uniref:Uncharacterized protein n=1 Tax=Oryza meyeriana var. granulata TaxID=110450 RepID=A0A6G1DYS5_9ORYZ|nr:hypothetical protein E2562_020986 [Oryza meyeriana var. granulata]
MQEASAAAAAAAADDKREVRRAVEEKPVVVVVGRRGCCMAHVARRLLLGQGANPTVLEVSDDADPAALVDVALQARRRKDGDKADDDGGGAAGARHAAAFPAVFIGGRLVGGLDRLMAMHIAGELVPVLKQAGALWL